MDGELNRDIQNRMDEHFNGCQQCRNTLNELQKVWEWTASLPEAQPVPYFYTRLHARLVSNHPKKQIQWMVRALLPASLAITVVVGIWLGNLVVKNSVNGVEETTSQAYNVSSIFLESFDDLPDASLGQAYFEFASQE
jgi:predicted anti-sigma-YlaC factor YlaD